MAVATSVWLSSYTAERTHVASMSTSVDTHAPLLTHASAGPTCLRSPRVTRRTRTLLSTARVFLLYIAPHTLIEIF